MVEVSLAVKVSPVPCVSPHTRLWPTPFSVGSFMAEMLMVQGCVCVSDWAEKEEENL